jgi:hypothetical protein
MKCDVCTFEGFTESEQGGRTEELRYTIFVVIQQFAANALCALVDQEVVLSRCLVDRECSRTHDQSRQSCLSFISVYVTCLSGFLGLYFNSGLRLKSDVSHDKYKMTVECWTATMKTPKLANGILASFVFCHLLYKQRYSCLLIPPYFKSVLNLCMQQCALLSVIHILVTS